jgi:anti-sigma B factor antagonist
VSPAVPSLRTTVERTGRSVVVCADGELDLATAPAMRQALAQATGDGPADVVVDLARVTFVDAAGLAPMVDAADAVRAAGGRLQLASPSRMLRRVLALLDLEERLPVAGASRPAPPAQNSVGVPDSRPRSSS